MGFPDSDDHHVVSPHLRSYFIDPPSSHVPILIVYFYWCFTEQIITFILMWWSVLHILITHSRYISWNTGFFLVLPYQVGQLEKGLKIVSDGDEAL